MSGCATCWPMVTGYSPLLSCVSKISNIYEPSIFHEFIYNLICLYLCPCLSFSQINLKLITNFFWLILLKVINFLFRSVMISEQMNLSGGWSNLLVRFRWDIPTSSFFIIIGSRSTKCQVAFLACKWKGYCNLVSKLSIQWLTINSLIGCPMSIEISYFCSW